MEGEFNISNWVGYIDKGEGSTIAEFEAKYPGTTVNYTEDVNDNAEFFGKVQPLLDQGESGGRSMFVVTDWMAKQMYDLGYLQEIDYADVPNVDANLQGEPAQPGVRPRAQVLDPVAERHDRPAGEREAGARTSSRSTTCSTRKYKGKVTVLTEMRDTIPLMLKADGIDPAEATKEDWLEQIDKLQEAVDSGQLRRFTGNDYVQDLDNENVVAAIGWSGDVGLIANEDVDWRMPTDGCILWSDNMVIPVGAPNTAAALAWADFVYDPKVQADISDVRPLRDARSRGSRRCDPSLAENVLVNPPDDFTADCSTQPDPPGSEEDVQEVTEAFQAVITQ